MIKIIKKPIYTSSLFTGAAEGGPLGTSQQTLQNEISSLQNVVTRSES